MSQIFFFLIFFTGITCVQAEEKNLSTIDNLFRQIEVMSHMVAAETDNELITVLEGGEGIIFYKKLSELSSNDVYQFADLIVANSKNYNRISRLLLLESMEYMIQNRVYDKSLRLFSFSVFCREYKQVLRPDIIANYHESLKRVYINNRDIFFEAKGDRPP